jgi:type VI secretion system secreted protein VgrG
MGVCITSYALAKNGNHPGSSEPAGDNLAGMALSRRLFLLGKALNDAARTHQTVRLSSHIGTLKADQSALNENQAPLQAMHTAISGMVNGLSGPGYGDGIEQANADAASKNTAAQDGKLPHSTDPILSITARAGLALVAGQNIQVAAGEGITLGAGQDLQIAAGGAARLYTGQAIGVLGGAIKPGEQAVGKGLSLIAAQGEVELQAQSDQLQIAAKGLVNVQSQHAHIDWAAAKRIVVSVAGGASMTMEGGNITFECPGTITVKAGKKSFVGPEQSSYALRPLPRSVCVACLRQSLTSSPAFTRLE